MRRLSKLLLAPTIAGLLAFAAPVLAQETPSAHSTHAEPKHEAPPPRAAHPAPVRKGEAPKADKNAEKAGQKHTRQTARAEERENHAREMVAYRKSADQEKQRHQEKLKQLRQDKHRVDKSKDKGWKSNVNQQLAQELARHKQWQKEHKAPSAHH